MFSHDEINAVIKLPVFQDDWKVIRQKQIEFRLGVHVSLADEMLQRLTYFVDSVVASAPLWDAESPKTTIEIAAEIAEFLGQAATKSDAWKRLMRFNAAVLYELADKPSLAQASFGNAVGGVLENLFCRKGVFRNLSAEDTTDEGADGGHLDSVLNALCHDALRLAEYQRGVMPTFSLDSLTVLLDFSKLYYSSINAGEMLAYAAMLKKRASHATRRVVSRKLFSELQFINFPAELWGSQIQAINSGMLNSQYDSWGLAAPTGTGKTFLTRVLILDRLSTEPESKVIYVVPSKALVSEVANDLGKALNALDIKVVGLGSQLVSLSVDEADELDGYNVAVMTPEKADLLLRLGVDYINKTRMVIVDEAHHIESGTRGVLLEFYLWRLRQLLSKTARFILLSAVAPNISELTNWLGRNPASVVLHQRSTRMRAGVYRYNTVGAGYIDYADGTSITVVANPNRKNLRTSLVQLAHAAQKAGPVLVVAKGKKECEHLAETMCTFLTEANALRTLTEAELASECIRRLDSRLEREMYEEISMRVLLRHRIVYHHAGLPPRVRNAVEDAIRKNYVDYVFATTTLAEGVNFPFSSVIVQSLALKDPPEKGRPSRYSPITPRTFWNIAGRAGRPGADREGQVILFEPALGIEKVEITLNSYLDPSIGGLAPVTSALALGVREILVSINKGEYAFSALHDMSIPSSVSKRVRGTLNLIRISLLHADAASISISAESLLSNCFAARFLSTDELRFANVLFKSQNEVVRRFVDSESGLPKKIIAELGLSFETIVELRNYVKSLENWRLQQMSKVVRGGAVSETDCVYVLSPTAARMAELEGPRLGGFYSEVIKQWIFGIPLAKVMSQVKRGDGLKQINRLEDLIGVIYTRIQYLLPWGLYAMNSLVELECKARGIDYAGSILQLAYLADAGVPDFGALRLVNLGFERVDAARLGRAYRRDGGVSSGVDIVRWVQIQKPDSLKKIVAGEDNRRVDYDLNNVISRLSGLGGSLS